MQCGVLDWILNKKISETVNEIQIRSRVNNITLMLIFCFENYTVII